jgi:hypothetical protein
MLKLVNMTNLFARLIERILNPRSWQRQELECDFVQSAATLEQYHRSPGWALEEMTRTGSLPSGVLSASGSDNGSVTVYLDSRKTTLEKVLQEFGKNGLFFHRSNPTK